MESCVGSSEGENKEKERKKFKEKLLASKEKHQESFVPCRNLERKVFLIIVAVSFEPKQLFTM